MTDLERPGGSDPSGFLSLFEKIICLFKYYYYLCSTNLKPLYNGKQNFRQDGQGI